jgi:hypothetical protein
MMHRFWKYAKETLSNSEYHKYSKTVIHSILVVNPRDLIGSNFENPELIKNARITSFILTLGNWIDAVLVQSLLTFAVGWLPGLLINWIVLVLKNIFGLAIVRTCLSNSFRTVAIFGLIGLSSLSCLTTGVGTELTLNQPGLIDILASQIVQIEEKRVNAIKPDTTLSKESKDECEKANDELKNLPPTGPRHDTAWLKTYGRNEERGKKWDLKEAGIPLCERARLLKEEEVKQLVGPRASWENKVAARSKIGNDLMFLKQEMTGQYQKYFTDNGEFRSGVEAIKLAHQSFYGKLVKGDFAGLSASLFFSLLSIITTITACGAVITFPSNQDVNMSWIVNEPSQSTQTNIWNSRTAGNTEKRLRVLSRSIIKSTGLAYPHLIKASKLKKERKRHRMANHSLSRMDANTQAIRVFQSFSPLIALATAGLLVQSFLIALLMTTVALILAAIRVASEEEIVFSFLQKDVKQRYFWDLAAVIYVVTVASINIRVGGNIILLLVICMTTSLLTICFSGKQGLEAITLLCFLMHDWWKGVRIAQENVAFWLPSRIYRVETSWQEYVNLANSANIPSGPFSVATKDVLNQWFPDTFPKPAKPALLPNENLSAQPMATNNEQEEETALDENNASDACQDEINRTIRKEEGEI